MQTTEGRNRFVGMASFTEKEQDLFFGRAQDIERLTKLIQLEKLVVLFSKSGTGKSSLLKAGIEPRLREKNYAPYRIRFFNYNPAQAEKDYVSPTQVLENTLGAYQEGTFLDEVIEPRYRDSVWARLKCKQILRPAQTQLLVMDQFEELFTHPTEEVTWFKYQLADVLESQLPQTIKKRSQMPHALNAAQIALLYAPSPVAVVLSLRADYLSYLQQLRDTIPYILSKTYELAPLNRELAKEAILKPAAQVGKDFATAPFEISLEAQNDIILQLEGANKQIETFQLQTIGSELERIVKEKRQTNPDFHCITPADLPTLGDIWTKFYAKTIDTLPAEAQMPARKLLEENLVQAGRRITLDEVVCAQILPDSEALKTLVNSRLLYRLTNNTQGYSYEVSHDTLIAPITQARETRQAEEAKVRAEAENKRREAQAEIERQEKQKIQKQLQRTRLLLGGAVVGLLIAIVAVFYAWQAQKEAVKAQKEAEKAQKKAKANETLAIKAEKKAKDNLEAFKEAQEQNELDEIIGKIDRLPEEVRTEIGKEQLLKLQQDKKFVTEKSQKRIQEKLAGLR